MAIWEERLRDIISPAASKWPYRIVQVKPNRKYDSEIYTLSGREEDIASNGSLFLAIYDLINRERIHFEEWWEQWESGFPALNNLRTAETSNYLLTGISPWRKPENRPRYREWSTPEQREQLGYRTIEYWKDRSNEKDSIILSGTDSDLIKHIIQIHYEGGSSVAAEENLSGKNSKPVLRGWPVIKLVFYQSNSEVGTKPSGSPRVPVKGEKLIRCVGFTDDTTIAQQTSAELIKSSDIRLWAQKIQSTFGNPPYKWDKGKMTCSYTGQIPRLQGLEGYAYVRTRQDGIQLFTRLLSIFNFTPDPTSFRFTENNQPETAYPENPENFVVLGKTWQALRTRPIASVMFDHALLYLPKLEAPIELVKGSSVVYKD